MHAQSDMFRLAEKVPSASNSNVAVQAQEESSKADTMIGCGLSIPNYKPSQDLSSSSSSSSYKPAQEITSPNFEPTECDILCGRGRGRFLHEGNTLYLSLLRKNLHVYANTTKRVQKGAVVTSIVTALKNQGYRFLKQKDMSQRWSQLSETEAYDRTAHAIRDLIRKKKLKKLNPLPPTASRSQFSASMKIRNSSTTSSVSSSISLLEIPKSVFSTNAGNDQQSQHKPLNFERTNSVKASSSKISMEPLLVTTQLTSSTNAETAVGALSIARCATNNVAPLIRPPIFEPPENGNQRQPTPSFDIFFELDSIDFGHILREVEDDMIQTEESPGNNFCHRDISFIE